MHTTTSASRISAPAADVPVTPAAPTSSADPRLIVPLPAMVSATGMPNASANEFELVVRVRVLDTAASNDQRSFGCLKYVGGDLD